MRLYLDDDSISRTLQQHLTKAGYEIILPTTVGLAGCADPEHLTYAIKHQLTLLTGNYDDFFQLHELVQACGGHHHGILVIRRDNDNRDMKPHQIVIAMTNMQAANPTCSDLYVILNHWR